MPKLAGMLLRHPISTLFFTYSFFAQVFLVLLRRLLLPHFPAYQDIRIQINRAYLSSSAIAFPDLVHRLPVVSCPETRARKVGTGWTGYIVPGQASLPKTRRDEEDRSQMVALYAHGGGYARGEARMYLNYMERWIKVAAEHDLRLVFLSVEYRKQHRTLTRDDTYIAPTNSFIHTTAPSGTEGRVPPSISVSAGRGRPVQANCIHGRFCWRCVPTTHWPRTHSLTIQRSRRSYRYLCNRAGASNIAPASM